MDQLDMRIVSALQEDGRLTNQELGEKVGLSASQCSRRRTRLEETGVIEGYSARISRRALGLNVTCLVSVRLATHNPDNAKRLARLFERLENIVEAHTMTGSTDYVIKVVTNNLDTLATFINEELLPHESVQNVETSVVLQTLKETPVLPVQKT